MKLAVRVKPGAHRDGLWREGDGLFVQIRAIPKSSDANDYLIKYLSGSLRVAASLVAIVRGRTSNLKTITINADDADLKPMLDALPSVPQASLFDE